MVISFCALCNAELQSCDSACSAWQQICEDFIKHGPLHVDGQSFGLIAIIRFLEKDGFVVSTECDFNAIIVKPIGTFDSEAVSYTHLTLPTILRV